MLTIHTIPIEPATLAALNDCQTVHRLVVNKFFPNLGKDLANGQQNANKKTPMPFRLCLPGDALGTPGTVTLMIRCPRPEVNQGVEHQELPLEDGSRVRVRLALGPNLRPDTEKGVHSWAKRIFQRNGMDATWVRVGRREESGVPGRIRFTHWDVTATIKILDPVAAKDAFVQGIGSGREYGYGLIIVDPPEPTKARDESRMSRPPQTLRNCPPA